MIEAFRDNIAPRGVGHLVLAGPSTAAVADDPEGLEVLEEILELRESCTADVRRRVHVASLPMEDAEENAAIVNALQRRAEVVAQKSLAEGFGLTVSEAMWKGRPVVASDVGGSRTRSATARPECSWRPGTWRGSRRRSARCWTIPSGPRESAGPPASRFATTSSDHDI